MDLIRVTTLKIFLYLRKQTISGDQPLLLDMLEFEFHFILCSEHSTITLIWLHVKYLLVFYTDRCFLTR